MSKKIDTAAVDSFAEALEKAGEGAKDGVSFDDLPNAMSVLAGVKGFVEQLGKDKLSTLLELDSKISAMIVAERQAAATE